MRGLFVIIIVFSINNLMGQEVEAFLGANNNIFHDYNNNEGHFRSVYTSDYGFSGGLALDNIKFDWLTLRFTLQFDNYKGKLNVSDGGLGGDNKTIANTDKSVISLGVFPINCQILKRINLNFGFIISRLINESFDGTISGWAINQPNYTYNLQDKYTRISTLTYLGLQGRIAYDFKISKSLIISPQYIYYFGLSNEFAIFPETTKSMRHYFSIGIKRSIK
ncbi:MAG: hypothetical protein ACP5PZ_00760 [Bacteroidales bacterium]